MGKTGHSEVKPSVATVTLTDGVRLHVEEYGDPAADVTVVLLHGWVLDIRLWRRQITDLPTQLDAPVRVLAFDLRGHGRSTATPRHTTTLAQLADDLSEVLRERVPSGKVVLVGHSMGGMAIFEYAHRYHEEFAERIGGVVVMNTSAEGDAHTTYGVATPLARLLRLAEMTGAAMLARSGPWRPHRNLMPALNPVLAWLVFGPDPEPAAVQLTASMIGRARLAAIGGFRPWIDEHDRVDALERMGHLPVAVLSGTKDRLTPAPCAQTIVTALPHASHIACEEAGHMLPLERPDEVTDAIAEVCRQSVTIAEQQRGKKPLAASGPQAVGRLTPGRPGSLHRQPPTTPATPATPGTPGTPEAAKSPTTASAPGKPGAAKPPTEADGGRKKARPTPDPEIEPSGKPARPPAHTAKPISPRRRGRGT